MVWPLGSTSIFGAIARNHAAALNEPCRRTPLGVDWAAVDIVRINAYLPEVSFIATCNEPSFEAVSIELCGVIEAPD